MSPITVEHNIKLYRVFALFNDKLFWGPIVIISIQRLGKMTLPDIYFMESTVMILCILLNIPAGAIADTIGRKKTLIIGRFFLLVSGIGFACMSSPLGAWVGNILWAIGYSFQSGADQALLYNSLKSAGREAEFAKIEGSAVGARFVLMSVSALFVGVLAEYNMRLPLLLSLPFFAIPLVAAFYFIEEISSASFDAKKQVEVMIRGLRFAMKRKSVLWIILFCSLITGASKIWFFTYNPYLEKVGVGLKYFGVIFFFLNVVAWLSSHYAHRAEEYFSEKVCVATMIACVGFPIIIMGAFPCWQMALLVFAQNIVRGFMGPFVGNFMNRHIDFEEIRATALSVRSTLTDIVSVVSLLWFGLMDRQLGLLASLVILGTVVLVLGLVSFAHYKRLFPETDR